MVWLTDKAPILQSNIPNKIESLYNQIYYHKGNAYLIPRGLVTDGYTIPFNIDKTKRDIRPSMLHDIGCKFHEVILIDLPIRYIETNYLYDVDDITVCRDIPKECLKVIPVSFHKCNKLLKDAMIDCNIPKNIAKLYYLAVHFNLNWILPKRVHIDLDKLYVDNIIT